MKQIEKRLAVAEVKGTLDLMVGIIRDAKYDLATDNLYSKTSLLITELETIQESLKEKASKFEEMKPVEEGDEWS